MDMYLDKRYEFMNKNDSFSVPSVHVIYHVTKYPDYSDSDSSVTRIEIADPSIYVYGLSMNSSKEDISSRTKKEGFQQNENSYSRNNCTFIFSSEMIAINANVSNRNNISF